MIQPVQILAADLKGRDSSGRVLDPDAPEVAAHAQEECPDEDVRGFVMSGDRSSPPLKKNHKHMCHKI